MLERQGLHKIIPQMALLLKDKVHFKIIGGGGLIQKLNFYIEKFNLDNVNVSHPVDRDILIDEYKRADVLFAPK